MSDGADIPEADRAAGAPHPRTTQRLIGQAAAEAAFLEAQRAGRRHHAWLITGPRGVGKATLAWRIARFLLAGDTPSGGLLADPPPETLDVPDDAPILGRIKALSEPRLFLLRPAWDAEKKRLRQVITVDEVRRLRDFFALSATDGGNRVVIVDCADEMNGHAANALLKILEEPPRDATLLLISHQPSRLLHTIRSRCRTLRCTPLGPDDLQAAMTQAGGTGGDDPQALSELSGGSVGEAMRLTGLDGTALYADIIALFQTLPHLDRMRALKLAESAAGRGNAQRFDLLLGLMDTFLARVARGAAGGPPLVEAAPGERALIERLSAGANAARMWAQLQQQLSARAAHGRAVNLDPSALILDMIFKINDLAVRLEVPPAPND